MVTDLVEIRRLGDLKKAENLEFRRYLAAHHHRIETFQTLAAQIQKQIDCTACANCCRDPVVTVSRSEIEALARRLGVEAAVVEHRYTAPDPESHERRVLKSTKQGCVFLKGNLCSVYEARPQACRDFPHLSLGTHSLGGRVSSVCRWVSLCPIVYNALERYKKRLGYHPPAAR